MTENDSPTSGQYSGLFPGIAVSVLVAVAAQFISEHYGAPAMLMALLLGLSLNFLSEPGTRTHLGIEFSAATVLRFGVALLGARISVQMLADLGVAMILLVIAGVAVTIVFALLVARPFKSGWRFSLLTGGAVAICGASAAMAISAVLPRTDKSDRELAFTVISVTVLSTVAMVAYPMLSLWFGFSSLESAVFLGGTIHDVAQVVGAGFSVSADVGETAALVKLIRVSMLAPVVLIFSLTMRATQSSEADAQTRHPPLLPGFVLGFLVLAMLNSLGVIPDAITDLATELSRWALLVAIAAVGIKTSLPKMMDVGRGAIGLMVAETLVLCGFVLIGVHLIG